LLRRTQVLPLHGNLGVEACRTELVARGYL
jgi:hypothetical protein